VLNNTKVLKVVSDGPDHEVLQWLVGELKKDMQAALPGASGSAGASSSAGRMDQESAAVTEAISDDDDQASDCDDPEQEKFDLQVVRCDAVGNY